MDAPHEVLDAEKGAPMVFTSVSKFLYLPEYDEHD